VTRKVEQLIVRLAEENRDWGISRRPPGFHILAGTHKRGRSQWRSWNASFTAARGDQPRPMKTRGNVFDQIAKRLFVRHEWHAMRHAGTDEFTLDEFLIQRGAAPEALLALLFDRVTAET
jgi:hypothetical protein